MIIVNRLYTVLSMVLIILVTVFYLVYMSKYENREYVLYMQSNSSNPLQSSSTYNQLKVLDSTTSSYTLDIGKVYLDSYTGYRNTGKFTLIFSQPGQISFKVVTDNNVDVGKYSAQSITPYYPIYVDFHAPSGTKFLQIQYTTTSQSVVLYKLSIEFY